MTLPPESERRAREIVQKIISSVVLDPNDREALLEQATTLSVSGDNVKSLRLRPAEGVRRSSRREEAYPTGRQVAIVGPQRNPVGVITIVVSDGLLYHFQFGYWGDGSQGAWPDQLPDVTDVSITLAHGDSAASPA